MEKRKNSQGVVYRCNYLCPIGKRCFIFKTTDKIKHSFTVLFKCLAKKRDIEIPISGTIK